MKAKEVLEKYQITRTTLSRWVKNGVIKHTMSPTGRYIYSDLINKHELKTIEPKLNVIYSRVSTSNQKDNLNRQIERLRLFCSSKGIVVDEIIKDIASALNYNRSGYRKLVNLIINKKVDNVIIEYKDRLLRIGFEDFKYLCDSFGTNIVVVDNCIDTDKDKNKEITEDLVSIIQHFSTKIYSNRKRKKIVDMVVQTENSEVES